jgi:hypothetical protein
MRTFFSFHLLFFEVEIIGARAGLVAIRGVWKGAGKGSGKVQCLK